MNYKGMVRGAGGTAISGGAGSIAFYVHRMLSEKVTFVQEKPLSAPIGMLVLGHVMKTRPRFAALGSALIGAAGYAGAQIWEVRKAMATSQTTNVKGFEDDTGAVIPPRDIGALVSSSDVGDFDDTAGFTEVASAYNDALNLGL